MLKTLGSCMQRTLLQHACDVQKSSPALIQLSRSYAAGSNQMALIKELRERSGAPVSEVKAALVAANWDMDKAIQDLRKKGLSAAGKKSTRHAAEGLVALAKGQNGVAIVEINSETDFVARNQQFMDLVSSVARTAVSSSLPSTPTANDDDGLSLSIDALKASTIDGGNTTVEQAVTDVAGVIRENIRLRRAYAIMNDDGQKTVVGSYLHAGVGPGLGRIAALVSLKTDGQLQEAALKSTEELANKLAMHVVGALPKFLDASSVPEETLEAERQLLREQAARTGKPEAIIEKMVEGRLKKFYEEVCLLEQPYIMDDKQKVKDVVNAASKSIGSTLSLDKFVRVQVGEGLEEEKKDFAAEVAEALQQK